MNTVEEKWPQIIEHLRVEHELSNVSFSTWIKPLKVYDVINNTVFIMVNMNSSVEYIEKKYLLPLKVCIAEITGEEGYSIHRLLKYPCTDDGGKNGFTYHDETPLDVDIVIVDEISMVDAYLFYYLLRAIPSGAKLICLGDMGQLESIGCGNIAFDMINSPEIPTVYLSQVHRQAAASAIITEARRIRKVVQIVEKDCVGTETRG